MKPHELAERMKDPSNRRRLAEELAKHFEAPPANLDLGGPLPDLKSPRGNFEKDILDYLRSK